MEKLAKPGASAQISAPLLAALQVAAERPHTAFYTPGHKRGQSIPHPLVTLLGARVFRADLPELPQLDNLFVPQGVLQEAQELAAAAFGAGRTWFLVNGSTCGVEAAILATCNPGDKLILPRTVHQSAIAGLILSGAQPVFINPDYDSQLDIAHCVSPTAVAAALTDHPDARAVLIVSPTYYGVCGDVAAIAQVVHQYGIPLLVDEAHGPHFAFHDDLPLSALAAGADLAVQSIHKVLSALTQAAMLHVSRDAMQPGRRIDCDRISQALQFLQSSSPSYLLLASLDAARQQMALSGEQLMAQTLHLARDARSRIQQIPGLSVLEESIGSTIVTGTQSSGFFALDPTRLTVTVTGLGLTGFEADAILDEQLAVAIELPSQRHLTSIISLGNTPADIDRLVSALTTLAQEHQLPASTHLPATSLPALPALPALSPREAFSAATETRSRQQAIGCISAELICPYPPGIPVLLPGEHITATALDYLQQILALGGTISGCADPTLQTLKIAQPRQYGRRQEAEDRGQK